MKTVTVSASSEYKVFIGAGALSSAGEIIRAAVPKAERAAVVTDDTVNALYGAKLLEQLAAAGLESTIFVLEHGEKSKNAENFVAILNFLAESRLSRSDVVVALGGGVVGDIAGFAAACYMRGVECVQIPTTLLAMVDSSVGGKTAVDLEAGKNLAGAFHQPAAVICDCSCLDTLPRDYFRDGCAEVIKTAVLGDGELFAHLAENKENFDRQYVISRCVEYKAAVVAADERDTGERAKLNLGHSLGHAIEKRSGFALSHGKSVAAGLACVCRAAASGTLLEKACSDSIVKLLADFGLPTKTEYEMRELRELLASDKKRRGGSIELIVPREISKCEIASMPLDAAAEFLEKGL